MPAMWKYLLKYFVVYVELAGETAIEIALDKNTLNKYCSSRIAYLVSLSTHSFNFLLSFIINLFNLSAFSFAFCKFGT